MTRSRAYLPLSQNFGEHSVGFSRTTYAHFPVVKNLVSYWPFVEGAGAAVSDYWGTNNGTLNQQDHWVKGRWGNGYDFDGTDDYVSVGVMGNFGSTLGSPTSYSFWIKTTTGLTRYIQGIVNDGFNTFYAIGVNSWIAGAIGWLLRDDAAKLLNARTQNIGIFDGNWHHVAIVVIPSADTVRFYIDGTQVTTVYVNQETPATFSNFEYSNIIGAQNVRGVISDFFPGTLDEVCIWDRALKRSEIVSMMWRRREG